MLHQSGGKDQQRKRVPPWRDQNALGSLGKEQRQPQISDGDRKWFSKFKFLYYYKNMFFP
jgi:hypothetical protein